MIEIDAEDVLDVVVVKALAKQTARKVTWLSTLESAVHEAAREV